MKLFGGLTLPTPFVTSIEADFACNAYSKHTCKVYVRPSRELVHFKKCFSAFSSNTPGRHCREKNKNKNFFWNVQTHDLVRTCTLQLCLLYAWQAKSASIDVTNSALSGRGLSLELICLNLSWLFIHIPLIKTHILVTKVLFWKNTTSRWL